jgi:hypothetical protein
VNKQGSELSRLMLRARLRASSCLMVRRLVQGIGNRVSLGSLCNDIYKFLATLLTVYHTHIPLLDSSCRLFCSTNISRLFSIHTKTPITIIMFTLRQSLAALAAVVAAPLASAAPITTFSRIGASSNGMDILDFQIHAAMSPGHLTENTTMSFVVDTHTSKITCTGTWAPEGPFPQGEYVSLYSKDQ